MNIRLASDLHLESNGAKYRLPIDEDNNEQEQILVLAGDIVPSLYLETYRKFFVDVCCRFKNVIYIPGNHEYYHGNINEVDGIIKKFFDDDVIFDNLYFVNKETITLDDTVFICATLWTDCDNENPITMTSDYKGLADYHWIALGDWPNERRLTTAMTVAIHKDHRAFIESELQKHKDEKVVVITHHSPSYHSVPERFINDRLNPFFHSNLEHIILDHEPIYWIHGHTHESADYAVGNSRVVCNPMGYLRPLDTGVENKSWNPLLTLVV